MDGGRPDRCDLAGEGRGDLDVHAREMHLAGEQVGYVFPVPGRGDRAVDQGGSTADDLTWVRDEARNGPLDDRPEQGPAAAHGGLADPEERARPLLGDVLA